MIILLSFYKYKIYSENATHNSSWEKEFKELMIKFAKLRHRDLIKEIVYEYERRGNFVRIFPAPGSNEYEKYFQYQKQINRYLYKVLLGGDLISKQEVDLKSNYKLNYEVPKLSSYEQFNEEQKVKIKSTGSSEASTANETDKLPQINKGVQDNSKVVITGDDVLIEYVTRLIKKITYISEDKIGVKEVTWIENFINHYVWHNSDIVEGKLWERLQNRLGEMILRRKKLLKSLCKKEALASNPNSKDALILIPSMIEERENQKSSLLENFTVGYLEEMLKSTTKSIARDVVSTLIPYENSGTLLIIEKKQEKSKEVYEENKGIPYDEEAKSEEDKSSSENENATYIRNNDSQFDDSDPYKTDEISGVNQSSSSTVKFPPATQKQKITIKDKSSNSLRNSMKNRSSSSRPNSKGL